MLDRTMSPKFEVIDDVNFVKPESVSLKNGIKLDMIPAGSDGVVKLDVIQDAGSMYQTKPLIANFTNAMLKEGNEQNNASQVADQLDYFGSLIQQQTDKEFAINSLITVEKFFPSTLQILSDNLEKPVFSEDELAVMLQNNIQYFLLNQEKVNVLARDKFLSVLFGIYHPYGRQVELEDYQHLKRQDLIDFHRQHHLKKGMRLLLTGGITDAMVDLLEQTLGQIALKEQSEEVKHVLSPPPTERIHKVPKENTVQAGIRIGLPLFNHEHPDFNKMKVLATILGGYFGSRLMQNIREDKGYTYGISAIMVSLKQSGYFSIQSEVNAKFLEQTIDEIHKEIRKLRQERIAEEELQLVKNYMLGTLMRKMDGAFALSETYTYSLSYGLDNNYYPKMVEDIKDITSEEIQYLTNKYIHEDNLYHIIAGG